MGTNDKPKPVFVERVPTAPEQMLLSVHLHGAVVEFVPTDLGIEATPFNIPDPYGRGDGVSRDKLVQVLKSAGIPVSEDDEVE